MDNAKKTFTDCKGRAWTCRVDTAALRRVRDTLNYNLAGEDALQKLQDDPVLLIDTIFIVVQPQAQVIGVTAVDFGESLAGDAIDDATIALLEGLAEYFPTRRRLILTAAIEQTKRTITDVTPKVAEMVGDASKKLSSGSPESSGSIRPPSPSAN